MKILKKVLTLGEMFSSPKVEGTVIPYDLDGITSEVIERRAEVFPGCMEDENYDYINGDWQHYHSYVCMDLFPKLQFLMPIILEALEMVNDDYRKYYFKSWINIWPNKQSINPHIHYGEWHGYYVLKDTGTMTYYTDGDIPTQRKIVPLVNHDGHFVFMPAKILHWAQKNPLNDWRVSMGFNLSSWEEILREEQEDEHGRSTQLRNIIIPLKDYI